MIEYSQLRYILKQLHSHRGLSGATGTVIFIESTKLVIMSLATL